MSLSERVQRAGLYVHQWLYEKTGGRIGHSLGKLKTLLLYTTGAKTGKERVSALVYAMGDDGAYLVVGSDGGNDKNPGWVHNVRAQPKVEIQIGSERKAGDGRDPDSGRCRIRAGVADRQREQPLPGRWPLRALPDAYLTPHPGCRASRRLTVRANTNSGQCCQSCLALPM